jgi:transcriptional regulator with XRE-family HTH domain
MRERGVKQVELARAIGRSRSYVSQLMSGEVKEPSLSTAYAIADALGVNVQDFLDLMHEG